MFTSQNSKHLWKVLADNRWVLHRPWRKHLFCCFSYFFATGILMDIITATSRRWAEISDVKRRYLKVSDGRHKAQGWAEKHLVDPGMLHCPPHSNKPVHVWEEDVMKAVVWNQRIMLSLYFSGTSRLHLLCTASSFMFISSSKWFIFQILRHFSNNPSSVRTRTK